MDEISESHRLQLLKETESDRVLARLVPGLAHDLNSLLGVALTAATHATGTLTSLASSLDGATLTKGQLETGLGKIEEALRLVEGNLTRAAQLVGGLKQMTGRGAGAPAEAVDVRAILESLALTLGPAFRKSHHRLELEMPEVLPLSTRAIELGRVLLNLLQNALVHAFPPGKAGTVRVEARGIPDGVSILVRDDGDGMPPEVAAHAFDLYFTTRRDDGGTGLGLAIVRDLVEGALRGTIELRTSPAAGTSFLITLPNLHG